MQRHIFYLLLSYILSLYNPDSYNCQANYNYITIKYILSMFNIHFVFDQIISRSIWQISHNHCRINLSQTNKFQSTSIGKWGSKTLAFLVLRCAWTAFVNLSYLLNRYVSIISTITTGYYECSLRKQICLYLKENSKHLYLLNINTSLCYTVISSFHSFYNRHKWEQHHNHCYCISNKGDIFQGKLKFVKCSCLVNNLNFSD